MSARKAKAKLRLTQRALRDIAEIEAYSIAEWGSEAKRMPPIEGGSVAAVPVSLSP